MLTIHRYYKKYCVLIIETIEKWLQEGEVDLTVTRINMHGASGAGKTCTQLLLLNEPPPPPDSDTDSTPIACPAVKATRISIDDNNQKKKWKKVTTAELKNQLASELEKAPKVVSQTSVEETPKVMSQTSVEGAPEKTRTHEQKEGEGKPLQKEPVIEDIVKKIPHTKAKLSTNWAYFIDSGGQPAYRELLPLFSRAAALNIIAIDLTKGLEEECRFQYRTHQKNLLIYTELKYSNLDIIQSTISSEAILKPITVPYVTKTPDHPYYLIVGTRKKEAKKEDIKAMNETLTGCSFKNVIKNSKESPIIFPVNTLLPARSKEREEASVELCQEISNCDVSMKIKMPIRLFVFEIALQEEAEKKKRSFLTKNEVDAIGEVLELKKEEDVKEALQYLHNVTIILYYPDVRSNVVFVDPEPILDVLSLLIAITYIKQGQLHLIADPPPSPDDRHNLSTSGCFKEDLLNTVGASVFVPDQFESHDMIKLLKHLHIIAEVKNREEGDYFLPCALPSYDKHKYPPSTTEKIKPLLVVWKQKDKKVTLPVPQGVFPLIVVHLLNQKDEVDFPPPGSDYYYKCHNAMSLQIYESYTLHIINRYTHIELYFDDDKKYCPRVWRLVDEAIMKSSNDIHVEQTHTRAFKCPRNTKENCYCIVENDRFTKCTKCPSPYEIPPNDESYWCWFNDSRELIILLTNIFITLIDNRWPTRFIAFTILVAMVAIIAGVYIYTLSGQNNIGTPNNHKRSRNEHTSSLNSPSVGNAHKTHAHFLLQETQNLCISLMHVWHVSYLFEIIAKSCWYCH